MKVVERLDEIAIVQFEPSEVTALRNTLNEVCNTLSPWDFKTRTGFSHEEFLVLLDSIAQSHEDVDFQFSTDELRLLNNALNEVCNGIRLSDFEGKIGVSRDQAKDLLNSIHRLIRLNA